MKVEYEHVLDTTHRHVQKADERDQQIARIVLTPAEYNRLRVEAELSFIQPLPVDYKESNRITNTIWGVRVVVEGRDEIEELLKRGFGCAKS